MGCCELSSKRVGTMVQKQKRDMTPQNDVGREAGLGGTRIAIKRFGSAVQISLQCGSDYQAIELYDRLVEAAEKGKVTIDLTAQ